MTKKKILLIAFLLIFSMLTVSWYVIGCPPFEKCPFFRSPKKEEPKKVTLTFVGPWDKASDWSEVISRFNEYKKLRANGYLDVNIEYERIEDPINYEEIIKERQFDGRGPNIFMVFNVWIPRYKDRILPMPEGMMSLSQFGKTFAPVARDDLIIEDKIYALPFYIDTLALYYNEDMLLNENYAKAPESWDEFEDYVEKLTILGEDGDIVRAGAAFGGGSNINRSQDIVMLLVMQNNASYGSNDSVSFNNSQSVAAVKFYTDFTDPKNRFYTWNEKQIYSIDAFTQLKAAMMINYSYHIDNVRNKTGGKLNFKIAPIPQADKDHKVNYASYWVPVVAKKAPCEMEKGVNVDCYSLAWEFLNFASQKENVKLYLDSVKKPAANLELAKEQSSNFDDMRSIFASQVFTARSWYHPDDYKSDKVLVEMIDSIVTTDEKNKKDILKAMEIAKRKIKWLN
jgi:ABC-type glycerol-3-phosphate transport system substrate-binding protein